MVGGGKVWVWPMVGKNKWAWQRFGVVMTDVSSWVKVLPFQSSTMRYHVKQRNTIRRCTTLELNFLSLLLQILVHMKTMSD